MLQISFSKSKKFFKIIFITDNQKKFAYYGAMNFVCIARGDWTGSVKKGSKEDFVCKCTGNNILIGSLFKGRLG